MEGPLVWAALTDGSRLRVLARDPSEAAWRELGGEAIEVGDPLSCMLATDRPGRLRGSAGTTRHAYVPRQDPHEGREIAFARAVANRLERAAQAGCFDRLVLVAPPGALHRLRAVLGERARDRLCGTIERG